MRIRVRHETAYRYDRAVDRTAQLDPLLLRVDEAARLTGIGRSLAYLKVASGEWPSISIGRARRVPLEGLKRWVEDEVAKSSDPVPAGR